MKFGTGMLVLLGWDVSMSATKRFLFEHCFVSLGVQISFGKTLSDAITVSNKPGRIESLKRAIDNVKAVGTLGFREALSIKGKVAYAEGQLFGRVAAPLCRFLSTWSSKGIDRQVTPELLMLLDSSLEALSSARPRVVSCHEASKPVIVFIDGACEPEGTSIGAILFAPGCNLRLLERSLMTRLLAPGNPLWTKRKLLAKRRFALWLLLGIPGPSTCGIEESYIS